MKRLIAAAGLALSILTPALAQEGAKPQAPARARAPRPDLSKDPTLYVVGYAHLDTQWRWTYIDTIKQFIPDTLRGNFKLFAKYPDYVFNFSGSRRYRMMEEYYPEDFETLKGYIAAGKWFPCGSSVDENDANVPSAESLIRHVLYGNKYFRQHFGIASEEYMLPDCFGFPAALPSVLAHCGIKGFSTQKLTWNAVVPIPFKVGVWEGPDGHSVVAALDPGAYVGEVKENLARSQTWLDRITLSAKTSGVFADYHYFGTGDQGGAPRDATVAMVQKSVETDGPIHIVSGPADRLFKDLTAEERQRLPRYKGELMLTEHSAGSISSEAYMKRWNRKNELLADAAERASVAAMWLGARDYPAQRLEDAWYLVLGSQMHDILPGTSVPKAYDLSWNDECLAANQFGTILEDAAGAVIAGMDTTGPGQPIVVYNPTSIERQDIVEASVDLGNAPSAAITGPDGKQVPAQVLADGRVAFLAWAPPVGYAVYHAAPAAEAQPAGALKVSERRIENEFYTVELDSHGDVSSIFDKRTNRETLAAPARLGLHYENPRNWPAWNQDWADRQLPPKAFAGESGPVTFKVVEAGPARVAVQVTRQAEGSTFTQTIRLASGGAADRIEFDTQIDWRSRERSLRASFPLVASNRLATYDIQVGALQRGNGHEKQYEYPFHQWFDLTDVTGQFGASILCDSKFASDKPTDNTVRLTLLHTPGTRGGYPDQGTQDIGRHHVLYAIAPHAGDWRRASTPALATRLNQPLIPFAATAHQGSLGNAFSLARTSDPNVQISAAKKSEAGDEIIIRLRERSGNAAKGVRVALAGPILSAREVDGQERPIGDATLADGQLLLDISGFELRAFAVKLGPARAPLATVPSTPITLPFDTDAVSTNADRTDGEMADAGAIPAEQFPGSITAEGVTFNLGPTADGERNAVACNGQELKLPDGNDRLYLIAAADHDREVMFQVDGKDTPLHIQGWNGYIGQWDRRVWPSEVSESAPGDGDIVGLDPGFVRPDHVAWYCSHHHTANGDAYYSYSYLYQYAIDLPPGAKSLRLPKEPGVKVFAASAARVGPARAHAAAPLFDTLSDHQQDAPEFDPASGSFTDATEIRISPTLYWRSGSVHYTTDGSDPTPDSPVYRGPIALAAPTTLKAAVERGGQMGPVATAHLEVNDRTPPTVRAVEAVYATPMLRVAFSEPVDASAADAAHYRIEPSLDVKAVQLAPDGRGATLTLGAAPKTDQGYRLTITGLADASPAKNQAKRYTGEFTLKGPVFSLEEVGPDQYGKAIKAPNLPVKAGDSWTMNMFVRTDKQVPNRTLIAGFGKCEQTTAGAARYMAKFAAGLEFWSHNRDVPSRAKLELNQWQMLTATYDGKILTLYKDARPVAHAAVSLTDDESVVNIAPIDPWEHERRFEGEVRGFSIWPEALAPEALRALREETTLP
jgi:alpha-mannosidase